MASVASRVFAITGGASGIGAATARLLARRGAAGICVGDISNQHLGCLEEDIRRINPSTRLCCTILDVTSSAEVDRWIQSVVATFGNLHGAANIAGIAQGGGMRETPTILLEKNEEWHKIMRTNLDGIFYATRAEVRAMTDLRGSSIDRSIVNVGSIAGMYHEPDVYAYGTSKGACSYFTKCVAKDAFPSGIRVNNVSPGK
jgi:chanoclavine-I dehydrogenase